MVPEQQAVADQQYARREKARSRAAEGRPDPYAQERAQMAKRRANQALGQAGFQRFLAMAGAPNTRPGMRPGMRPGVNPGMGPGIPVS